MSVRGKRVLILIDSATRDAPSQLLTACYLRRRGVQVIVCNQRTLGYMVERYRPAVLFVSWFVGEAEGNFLRRICRRSRIVLVDQEGGRMGEEAFKRAMADQHDAKCRLSRIATRVIAWGPAQAQWLKDLRCIAPDRIVTTGCPRLDPYLVPPVTPAQDRRFLGVTLRADRITSSPRTIVDAIFESLFVDPQQGLTPNLPLRAQYEDWIWQAVAVTRHMLKIAWEVSQRTTAPIVLRPGPWEQHGVYQGLTRHMPRLSIEPMQLQHEYTQQAFATVDASSALGLEAILAGTPVISVNALVPGLEAHVGGAGGTRFNAPYRPYYWHPSSVEEAVDLILQAQRGALPVVPTREGLDAYFQDHMQWPSDRPASFAIGDLLMELLDVPLGRPVDPEAEGEPPPMGASWRRVFYRLPGSAHAQEARLWWRFLVRSPDRELYQRYHYFPWSYPHHAKLKRLFEVLWQRYEVGAPSDRAGMPAGPVAATAGALREAGDPLVEAPR